MKSKHSYARSGEQLIHALSGGQEKVAYSKPDYTHAEALAFHDLFVTPLQKRASAADGFLRGLKNSGTATALVGAAGGGAAGALAGGEDGRVGGAITGAMLGSAAGLGIRSAANAGLKGSMKGLSPEMRRAVKGGHFVDAKGNVIPYNNQPLTREIYERELAAGKDMSQFNGAQTAGEYVQRQSELGRRLGQADPAKVHAFLEAEVDAGRMTPAQADEYIANRFGAPQGQAAPQAAPQQQSAPRGAPQGAPQAAPQAAPQGAPQGAQQGAQQGLSRGTREAWEATRNLTDMGDVQNELVRRLNEGSINEHQARLLHFHAADRIAASAPSRGATVATPPPAAPAPAAPAPREASVVTPAPAASAPRTVESVGRVTAPPAGGVAAPSPLPRAPRVISAMEGATPTGSPHDPFGAFSTDVRPAQPVPTPPTRSTVRPNQAPRGRTFNSPPDPAGPPPIPYGSYGSRRTPPTPDPFGPPPSPTRRRAPAPAAAPAAPPAAPEQLRASPRDPVTGSEDVFTSAAYTAESTPIKTRLSQNAVGEPARVGGDVNLPPSPPRPSTPMRPQLRTFNSQGQYTGGREVTASLRTRNRVKSALYRIEH